MFGTVRKTMSMISTLAMLAALIPWGMGQVHATAPVKVLKVTEEVKPGETISIYGEHLSSALHTHVYLTENGNQDLPIEQYDSDGHVIRVILPDNVGAGAYTLHVQNDDGSQDVYVNKAAPKWLSDQAAYAGMTLKLMGRNLDAAVFGDDTNTQIRLVPAAGGSAVGASVTSVTPFDVTFTTPSSGLTDGASYYVEVNTNAGSTAVGTSWVRLKDDNGADFQLLYKGAAPADSLALSLGVSWSKDFNWGQVKDVKADFGARGDGSTDDLNAIQSGIDWLNANGGGVLYFPAGTYVYNGILSNKTGVILKGENRDTTILHHIGPSNTGINAPGQSLMGIANLKLTLDESAIASDDGFTFVADYGDAWGTPESQLQSDRMFFYNVWTDNSLSSNKVHVHYIVGGKENVLWAGNKLYGRGGVIYSVWLRQYVTVRDNTFDYSLWYNDFSASKALFLNNTITGHYVTGVSESSVGIHGFANNPAQGWPLKDLYFDGNTIQNMGQGDATGNTDGEIIQAEPPNAQLVMGTVSSASSNTVRFAKEHEVSGANWSEDWQALIVQGTGLGQLRNVTSLTDNGDGTATATVDRNWDVQPDATSKVVIRRMVEDMVISRTNGSNSTWGLVFYNVVYDGVIADNTLSHTQGAQSVGYDNADNLVAPTYFNQLKRNTTVGKSTGPSQFAAQGAECTWIGAPIEELDSFDPGTGYYAITNYATEIKNNTVDRYDCSSTIDWATWKYAAAVPLNNRNYDQFLPTTGLGTLGALVEGNDLKNSDYGIFLGKEAGTTFIKGNTYENITTGNIVDDGSTNTVVYSGSQSPPPPNDLALGITPTTSDSTAGSLAAITDGVSSDTESYVGITSGAQWIQIDLGQSYDLNKINVWHYYGDGRTYHDVIMQVSNDPSFASGVTTVFNNDADNSSGQGAGGDAEYAESSAGKSVSFSAVNARYVRVWSNGSTANVNNHYVEVEVYGNAVTTTSTNKALGITPTTSDSTAGSLAAITDGVSSDTESYVGIASGAQWIQIDLGQSYDLNKINVWHYYGDGRTYHDVIMQVSNDPSFASGVTTVYNNDTDNSSGQGAGTDSEYAESSAGKSVSFSAVNARYVRLWSNGSTANVNNHYVEVEVYGNSATTTPTNKALGITPTSSDSTASPLSVITDGVSSDTESYVGITSGAQWVQIDLGQSYDLSKINVWHYYGDGRTYHDVIMQVSNDPSFASGVTTVYNNDTDNSSGQGAGSDSEYAETSAGQSVSFSAVNARYVRLWSNGSSANAFNHYVEVEVYGK